MHRDHREDLAPSAAAAGAHTLLVGLATLAMAVFGLCRDRPILSGFDPRWLPAGGAAVVGLVLLVGSLQPFGDGAAGHQLGAGGDAVL